LSTALYALLQPRLITQPCRLDPVANWPTNKCALWHSDTRSSAVTDRSLDGSCHWIFR